MFRLSRSATITEMSDTHKEIWRERRILYSVMNYNIIIPKNEIIKLKLIHNHVTESLGIIYTEL